MTWGDITYCKYKKINYYIS